MRVFATREGLIGHQTASGWHVNTDVPFVALPSRAALHLWVHVSNPANGKSCKAVVLDIGPWNTDDDAYVFGGHRPRAESGLDQFHRVTNKAGIDLGQRVWITLDLKTNADVEWSFL